jgi:hypothetical protein
MVHVQYRAGASGGVRSTEYKHQIHESSASALQMERAAPRQPGESRFQSIADLRAAGGNRWCGSPPCRIEMAAAH